MDYTDRFHIDTIAFSLFVSSFMLIFEKRTPDHLTCFVCLSLFIIITINYSNLFDYQERIQGEMVIYTTKTERIYFFYGYHCIFLFYTLNSMICFVAFSFRMIMNPKQNILCHLHPICRDISETKFMLSSRCRLFTLLLSSIY